MTRIKVAQMASVLDGRSNSGTARVAYEIFSELSKHDSVTQTLIHFDDSDNDIYKHENITDLKLPYWNLPIGSRFFAFHYFIVRNFFSTKKNKLQFDICHWHVSRIYPFFWLFPAKKIILTMHDAGGYLLPGVNTFFTFINKVTIRLNLRKISKVIVVSENAKYLLSKAAKIPQDKIVVISNASHFSQLISRAPLTINQKFIVCVSRWQRHKNVGNLVEGFALFKAATESDIKLVLVGKPVGGFDEPLIKRNKLKLEDDIINLTDLVDVEIAWLFDNAVLNIFPSLHEGFGLSVLEGIMRDCPAIVHKYTATYEIAGAAGYAIDMNDPLEISRALSELLIKNPNHLINLKNNCKYVSRKFNWEVSGKKLVDLYKNSMVSA